MDWQLVIAALAGLVIGGAAGFFAAVQWMVIEPVVNVPPPPMPEYKLPDAKPWPSQTPPPKYNPLTRKIDHRN